jgi:hypothetical protein
MTRLAELRRAADPFRDVAKLALLIGCRLIDRGNPKVENRSAHGSAPPCWRGENAIGWRTKWRVLPACGQPNSRGFFRTSQSFSRHKIGRPPSRRGRQPRNTAEERRGDPARDSSRHPPSSDDVLVGRARPRRVRDALSTSPSSSRMTESRSRQQPSQNGSGAVVMLSDYRGTRRTDCAKRRAAAWRKPVAAPTRSPP